MTSAKKKRPGRPSGRTFDVPLHLRVDADLGARLDALAERVAATGLSRSAVARLLMLLGLDLAERDPRALLGAPEKTKGRK